MRNQFLHGRVLRLAMTLVGTLALAAGCSTSRLEPKRIDYKSSARGPALEVPPDLTSPVYDDRYKAITASGQQAAGQAGDAAKAGGVLPVTPNARIERAGNQRWLVLTATPELAWSTARDFWSQTGFVLALERPELGIMETDWAENRAKLPQDFITRTLSNVLGSLYSTNTLDRFRTRIERGSEPGTVEIYISHRGMEEVARGVSGGSPTGFVWQPRGAEPELEAEFLRRMMVRFGASEAAAAQLVAQAEAGGQPRARVQRGPDGAPQLVVDDAFDRAWRRVGLALDRSGFTVVDRDRDKGLYFVRFSDPDAPAPKKDSGFLSRLMFWRSDDNKPPPEQYRVVVTELPSTSMVLVQDPAGAPDRSPSAERILNLLQAQLK